VRRIVWAAVLLVALTFVSFVIFFIVPANPARAMTGPQAPPERVERVEKMLGLDDSVPVEYARFMRNLVVHQSLGRSVRDPPAGERHHQGGRARSRFSTPRCTRG